MKKEVETDFGNTFFLYLSTDDKLIINSAIKKAEDEKKTAS